MYICIIYSVYINTYIYIFVCIYIYIYSICIYIHIYISMSMSCIWLYMYIYIYITLYYLVYDSSLTLMVRAPEFEDNIFRFVIRNVDRRLRRAKVTCPGSATLWCCSWLGSGPWQHRTGETFKQEMTEIVDRCLRWQKWNYKMLKRC